MTNDKSALYEQDTDHDTPDPDETPVRDRKLITQPYDLVIQALMDQIKEGTLHLRPISEKPKFQRNYIWPKKLASRLIESILLNVPIPPCYLSQSEDFELDVIDGQQRMFSIYRFLANQFALSNLEVLNELNDLRYHELPKKEQLKLMTHVLRCVVVTNDSHPEIKFDVFERLNTNTIPLNSQELRNCMFRGSLNDLLGELVEYENWLEILGRKNPDRRMRDEELVLRFFAFYLRGVQGYKTPQKHWLNEIAREGKKYNDEQIAALSAVWKTTIDKCLLVFKPQECFRRLPAQKKSSVINRALMDLTMSTFANVGVDQVAKLANKFRRRYDRLFDNGEFVDLISKSIDHRKRTLRRFEIWNEQVTNGLF